MSFVGRCHTNPSWTDNFTEWAANLNWSTKNSSGIVFLGPPKARIMGISWKPWARMGVPSPADAHDARACGAHHEVTAAGGSSIIEFAGAAPRRPKNMPQRHTERVRVSQPFTS